MTVAKKPYYGISSEEPVKIKELVKVKGKTDGTFCFANKRYVIRGTLAADFVQGSWKWGTQVAFNIYAKDLPQVESRPPQDGYTRLAIALNPSTARLLCEELLTRLWELGV